MSIFNNKRKRNVSSKKPFIKDVIRENTAGGVVYRHNPRTKDIEFLLIQDTKDRWTIPKGHIEEDESSEITTAREIIEETGIAGDISILDYLGKSHFRYLRDGSLVLMSMEVFLVKAEGDTDNLMPEDWISDARWFSIPDTLEKIEYEDVAKLFLLGIKKIRQLECVTNN